MTQVRTFILLGQGGIFTSYGMLVLEKNLRQFGPTSVHNWQDTNPIIAEINSGKGPFAVIGYSLGANAVGWIGSYVTKVIDLGIGYDPSRKSPLTFWSGSAWVERAPHYKRLICYYNPNTWFFGGAKYDAGETVMINAWHLAVDTDPVLHDHTIAAVEDLANAQ